MSCSVECVSCISCYSLHSPAYINWLTSCSCSHFTRLLSLSLSGWECVWCLHRPWHDWLHWLVSGSPSPGRLQCGDQPVDSHVHHIQHSGYRPTLLPPHTLAVGYVGRSLCENVFLFCFVLKGSVEGGRGGHQDGDVSGWSVTSCDCTGVLRTALLPTPASLLSPSTLVMIKCPYTVLVLELVNVYVRWTSGNLVIW